MTQFKAAVLVLTIISIPFLGNAQDILGKKPGFFSKIRNVGVGGSGMYNFQTESAGFGARVNFWPDNNLSIVPQFTYYPGIGEISEYMLGLGLEYKIRRGYKFNYYLLAHGGYNHWTNASSSVMEGAQVDNWNLEGGAGITTNHCLRPFLEYRYNAKFLETHLRLGVLYVFGCKGNGSNGREPCPAFK